MCAGLEFPLIYDDELQHHNIIAFICLCRWLLLFQGRANKTELKLQISTFKVQL